ncbi:MAG: hypothetical protein KF744_02410 [Taibaiella sp.]|nr:hypothetical protein [Taibaiella sp.]
MKNVTAMIAGVLFAGIVLVSYDLPKGWFKAGSQPDKYEMGIDKGVGVKGGNAAIIKSESKKIRGFGTLMQSCQPGKYLGKKVKMSGYLKSEDVKGWAGFWFRVDGKERGESLSFDNMHDRAVKGTTEWKKYEIVLDVPAEATNLAYGALLAGTGTLWFDDIQFEIVETNEKSTGRFRPDEPTNLQFEN